MWRFTTLRHRRSTLLRECPSTTRRPARLTLLRTLQFARWLAVQCAFNPTAVLSPLSRSAAVSFQSNIAPGAALDFQSGGFSADIKVSGTTTTTTTTRTERDGLVVSSTVTTTGGTYGTSSGGYTQF